VEKETKGEVMNGERRQDIGLKMVYVILTAIITLLLSAFFNKTYDMAQDAYGMAQENRKNIAVAEQCYKDIDRRLTSIDYKLDKLLK